MKIKLYLHGSDYMSSKDWFDGNYVLCVPKLSKFFDIADRPKTITLSLSKKPTKMSYFCKPCSNRGMESVDILQTNGSHSKPEVYMYFYDLLLTFPNGCYVSVLA